MQRRRVLVENKLYASDDEQQSLLQRCERRQNVCKTENYDDKKSRIAANHIVDEEGDR